ncbi:MAG: ADP-ribosylglycohydrolase family protein, partial [Saccharopolyspora sp.]
MQQAQAVELAERWLRAVGTPLNEPDGVRVDHDNVRLGLEGWVVPWDNVAFLDGGDGMQRIFPPQRLIVTEPEGELREANTTPHPGFSRPVDWPGQPRYREFVDPEYDRAGFYRAGVPRKALVGWKVLHEDGRTTEQLNPKWIPGPRAVGLPRAQNQLETLLNYLQLGVLSHEAALALLFDMVVLLPLSADEPAYEVDPPRRLSAYSSPRKMPESCRWLRITVPTLVSRYPGSGLVINSAAYPRTEFGAEELARVAAEYGSFPRYQPEEPQVVVEPGLDGSFDDYAAQLREHFGLAEQPTVSKHRIQLSRLTGYDLTSGERKLSMLASCWVKTNAERRAAGEQQNWPADLHANGLEVRHEPSGQAYPVPATFGKIPLEGTQDLHRFWHGVIGAYVGFAVGDALGSAVDGMSWSQIQQHYGENGITAPDAVFDRPGQVSWRTQLLLFLTEGTVRGLRTGMRQDGDQQPMAMRSAHARWLVAQGMPWQQAAGALAAERPAPDGWLLNAPEAQFRRGVPEGLAEAVQRAIAEPGRNAGLHGPLMLMWALPDAVAAHKTDPQAQGWYRDPLDAGASAILAELFTGLFRRERFVEP